MRLLIYLFLSFMLLSSCAKQSSELKQIYESAEKGMRTDAARVLAELKANKGKFQNSTPAEWAKFHLLLSEAYDRTGSPQTSDSVLLEIISYCKDNGSAIDLRKAYCLLARVYQEANLQGAALNYYNKALAVECKPDSAAYEWAAYALARISDIYIEQKLFDKALQALDTASKYAAKGNDMRIKAIIDANYGACSLGKGDLDSCIAKTEKAAQTAERAGLTQVHKSITLSLLPAYLKKDDGKNALRVLQEAEGIKGSKQLSLYYLYYSLYYSWAGDNTKAEEYYRKCAALGNFTFQRDASSEIVMSFLKSERYKQLNKYLFPALIAQDSLNRAALSTSNDLVTTLDAKLHNEQKQKQKEARLYMLIFAISLFVVAGTLGAVFYMRYTRIRLRLQQEKLNNLLAQINERDRDKAAADKEEIRRKNVEALKDSAVYRSFHDNRFTPSYNDYRELEKAVNRAYDNCMERLHDIYPSIKDYELKACLLIKADVPLKNIAVNLGMEQNALSMLRARLYKKMFQAKKGSATMLDDFIKSL